jgi:hypothetical protein
VSIRITKGKEKVFFAILVAIFQLIKVISRMGSLMV